MYFWWKSGATTPAPLGQNPECCSGTVCIDSPNLTLGSQFENFLKAEVLSLDFRLCHQLTVMLTLVSKLEIKNKSSAFRLKLWTIEICWAETSRNISILKFRLQKPNWKPIWMGWERYASLARCRCCLESLECFVMSLYLFGDFVNCLSNLSI